MSIIPTPLNPQNGLRWTLHLGQWNAGIPLPRPSSLEESEDGLEGHEKELFMKFVRNMLQSAPEDRSTARELLEDEWLNSPDEG